MLPRSLRYTGRARKNCAQEKAACSGRDDTAWVLVAVTGRLKPCPDDRRQTSRKSRNITNDNEHFERDC